MKVLQVMSGSFTSGAGRGAIALNHGLRDLSVETRFLGRLDRQTPDGITAQRFGEWDRLKAGLLNRLYLARLRRRHGQPETLFHPVSHGLDPHLHPWFEWADLVHVQWSQAATLGPDFWRALPAARRPVVFTLRDMWLFTGGCHFSGPCTEYQRRCDSCWLLGGKNDITRRDLAFKRAAVPHGAAFIAISEHIADQARASTILAGADIRVIPNSVDTGAFAALDKQQARQQLGLPSDAFILGLGALHLSEARKGGRLMPEVMARVAADPALSGRPVHWALFGADPFPLPENATWFGPVDDNARLNRILSAADLFIMPSLQESFGKTTAEALAAGTPVLAFDQTPACEIIQHGFSGWIVPHGDAAALATGIREAALLPAADRLPMGHAGRRHVLSSYAPDIIARAHMALYAELIEHHKGLH
jgi:glycosyltransferase involved in cell wall biosynthesis